MVMCIYVLHNCRLGDDMKMSRTTCPNISPGNDIYVLTSGLTFSILAARRVAAWMSIGRPCLIMLSCPV
jgi:hypothetical protein